jgi:hypothetical protein
MPRYFRTTLAACAFLLAGSISAGDKPATLAPIDLGRIAYTGGAFTKDGKHFVYALLPKLGSSESEFRVVDTVTGKSESLGTVPLEKQQPKDADDFRWSLGVVAAEDDLSTVYYAQYGPSADLPTRAMLAWNVKEKAKVAIKDPGYEASEKLTTALKPVSVVLKELDAAAETARKKYMPIQQVIENLGKKELTVQIGEGAAQKSAKIDVTVAFRELYAAAMADYPKQSFPNESGNVLVNDEVKAVAQSGNWVFVHCDFYAHYGIRGRGYTRLLLVNIADSRLVLCEGLGSYSASGVRSDPIDNMYVRSPDGKCVFGISNNYLTMYRLPE